MEYNFKPDEVVVTSWESKTKGSWRLGTPNGVQVIHLPTGTIVTCEEERSQHRNRHLAFLKLEEILNGRN